MGKATLSITLTKTGANELTVGITPKSEGSDLVPAILVGSPEELDERFASAINGLVQDAETMVLKKAAQKASADNKKETVKKPEAPAAATTQQIFAGKVAQKVVDSMENAKVRAEEMNVANVVTSLKAETAAAQSLEQTLDLF